MGTRVIANPELAESNPLGIPLPKRIEKPLNRLLRKRFPHAFQRLDEQQQQEQKRRQLKVAEAA